MARVSVLNACLTPRASIPNQLYIGSGVILWVLIIMVWSILSYGEVVPSIFLPTPGKVFASGFHLAANGQLWVDIWASTEVVLLGFFISSLVAVPVGLLMGSFRIVQATIEPFVNFMRYLPVTSFVPLFILWIGIGIEQRVMVIIFGTFFQQMVMTADVSRGVSQDLLNASYTLGASRRDTVWYVLGPASLPGVLDMLRVTIGWAWTYVVLAELVAASSGLGYISMKAMRGFQVEIIFLAISIIGILGLLTDQIFRVVRLKAAPWAL